ncbi:MAG TPA: flavin reductase family protein [Chloroflexota bacterium]|nr:flavin reductase family protein [Chloroflexota bacterium]
MKQKMDIDYREAFLPAMEAMSRDGVLLVSTDREGRPGGMTVSWGTIGQIWGRHIFTVLVRPSRNTYGLIEATGDFTVNILPANLGSAVGLWGKVSGRDHDKWKESGIHPAPARQVVSPIVQEGILHFECRVVHRHDMAPEHVAPEIVPAYYPDGNFHRVFYGEIVACYGQ